MIDQYLKTDEIIHKDVLNKGQLKYLDELCAPNIVVHDPVLPGGALRGVEAYKAYVTSLRSAFPDLEVRDLERFGAGETVAVRMRLVGTHRDEFLGIPPTGRHIEVDGMAVIHYSLFGKQEEIWMIWDALGLLNQLGAAPSQAVSA